MRRKHMLVCSTILCCLSIGSVAFGDNSRSAQTEAAEYRQQLDRIKAVRASLTPGPTNDLQKYEESADGILAGWSQMGEEYYARLVLELVGPLSSGRFEDDRQSEVARRYALSALAERDAIPIDLELELVGHVMTDMHSPNAPKALLTVASVLALAVGPEESVSQMRELEESVNRIKLFGAARDLAGLERTVDENHQDWEARDPGAYGELMLAVVQTLATEPFGDARQYELAKRYARFALQKAGHISLEAEAKLVLHIQADLTTPSGPKGEQWTEQRTADMILWFQAWKRLHDTIDPTWDQDDLPESNVAPPPAASMRAGVAPEAIKDPGLRAKYEAAIEANRKKAERYREQHRARNLKRTFCRTAERYIVAAYSHPPHNMNELRELLVRYVADDDTRRRITQAVRANVGQ